MDIDRNFTIKLLEQCQPHELIRLGDPKANMLAIVNYVDRAQDRVELISLEGSEFPHPHRLSWHADDYCTSYGSEWILELQEGPECWPGNQEGHKVPGNILCIRDKSCLVLSYFDGKHPESIGMIDLASLRPSNEYGQAAAPVFRWKIWASTDHKQTEGAKPLTRWPRGD